MNKPTSGNHKTFLETYEKEIAPKIIEIDILLKTSENHLSISETAKTLHISEKEVSKIMKDENIEQIDKPAFFKIMLKGSSYICQLYKREINCGSPLFYTSKDVSYIYNIDKDIVNSAFDFLGVKQVTSKTLFAIFSQITL